MAHSSVFNVIPCVIMRAFVWLAIFLSRCYIISLSIIPFIVLPGKVFRRALDTGCINKLSAHDVIMFAYEQLHTAEREISTYISQSASSKTESVALDAL